MFCVLTGTMTSEDIAQAYILLDAYGMLITTVGEGKDLYLRIDESPEEDPEEAAYGLYMAEMAFNLNFRQVGWICPHCEADACAECSLFQHNECGNPTNAKCTARRKTCGHLSFTSSLDNAAFDKAVLGGTS